MRDEALCPPWVAALGERSSTPQVVPLENRIPELIRDLFPVGKESNGNWITHCPYHGDTNPSFAVKLEDGLFICYACDARGSLEELYAKVKNVSEEEARRIIDPSSAFVDALNREHAVVNWNGTYVILNEERDPIHNWKVITFSSRADLNLRYQNQTVFRGKKRICIAEAWLDHRDRREYRGIVFTLGKSLQPEYYNLWQGLAVTPREGICDLILEHIHDNICRKDSTLYRYVLSWMAQTLQEPWEKPGTALVLRGKQGTGKSLFCTLFGSFYGPHFTHATHPDHLTGKFNAHLKDSVIVFADESFWAGDKAGEGRLKALITEEWMSIEYKGKDVLRVKNHVRLLIATNRDWAVPAGLEERRFCVLDVGDAHMQDTAYFKALVNEWNNGGREAFLHYLLHFDFTKVNLRKVPQTAALMENKILSMSSPEQFWYEILVQGTLIESDSTWTPCIKKKTLHNLYIEYAKDLGLPRRSSETRLGNTIKNLCPHKKEINKPERAWGVGDLPRCREAFDNVLNWPNHEWESPQDPSCVPADSKPRRDTESASVQRGPLEELSWDEFDSLAVEDEPEKALLAPKGRLKEGEPSTTFPT